LEQGVATGGCGLAVLHASHELPEPSTALTAPELRKLANLRLRLPDARSLSYRLSARFLVSSEGGTQPQDLVVLLPQAPGIVLSPRVECLQAQFEGPAALAIPQAHQELDGASPTSQPGGRTCGEAETDGARSLGNVGVSQARGERYAARPLGASDRTAYSWRLVSGSASATAL
jgi:hypothetical protein